MLLKPIEKEPNDIDEIRSPSIPEENIEEISSPETEEQISEPMPQSDTTAGNSAITAFFNTREITIEKSSMPEACETAFLVMSIAESLPEADSFLHSLRSAHTSPDKSFCLNLKNKTEAERKKITELAGIMKMCGIFSESNILTESIFGKLSKAGKVADFIIGRWLEQFCQIVTVNLVKNYAEKHGLEWEVMSNVTVCSREGELHELDLIFSIGDRVLGTEQKSGRQFADYDKYRTLGLWLGLVPEHFLLVNACLENEQAADCIHYFYEYYVCNTASYAKTLMKMINNSMIL
ncbi:MAG: hypothetical protein K6C68_12835 [Ruminococcus sp.]|nr:hypothetical protein [Ruminococcus sp.]